MSDYLLGHDHDEWARLDAQHQLWRDSLLNALAEHGLEPGASVLEVGCGSGALLRDLATIVGPTGDATGLDRDREAASFVRRALPHVRVLEGDVQTTDLYGPYDLIVARWVFSFLDDPTAAVEHLVSYLSPQGRLVIQDYNHDGVGVWPKSAEIQDIFDAYREAYSKNGGDLWVAARLPQYLADCGLPLYQITPEAKAGPPGSPEWAWVETFVLNHLHTIDRTEAQKTAFRSAWEKAKATPGAMLYSPLVVTIVTGTKDA